MGNFDRRGNSGGGGRRDFGGRPTMHKAVCNKCGKDCEVPFQPRGDKPVYCKDCFNRPQKSDSYSAPQPQFKEQFDSINAKLDKILASLPVKKVVSKKE